MLATITTVAAFAHALGKLANALGKLANALGKLANTLGKIANTLGKLANTLGKLANTLGELALYDQKKCGFALNILLLLYHFLILGLTVKQTL